MYAPLFSPLKSAAKLSSSAKAFPVLKRSAEQYEKGSESVFASLGASASLCVIADMRWVAGARWGIVGGGSDVRDVVCCSG